MQTHSETNWIAAAEQGGFDRVQSQTPRKKSAILVEEPISTEALDTYLHHLCHCKKKPHHWLTPELCKLVAGKG